MVHRSPPPPRPSSDPQQSRLNTIRPGASSELAICLIVCHLPISMPLASWWGFNVEMAHVLARDMGVRTRIRPRCAWNDGRAVGTGYCDIVMASVAVTPERAQSMAFSTVLYGSDPGVHCQGSPPGGV